MLVPDGVMEHAERFPDRCALACGEATVSYGALARRIERVAAGLRTDAVPGADPRGHVVGLLIDGAAESEDFLAAFLGLVHAGAVAAPFSRAWPAADLERVIALCAPVAVIAGARDRARGTPSVATRPLAEIEAAGAGATASIAAGRRAPPGSVDDAFYVGFTSGSTGLPRGVVRAHRAWVESFAAMTREFGIGAGARVLVPGSLFFSFSLIAALHALSVGGTVVLPARPGPRALAGALRAGTDALHALPSLLHETLGLAQRRGESFPDVRRIVCAGEALPAETRALVRTVCPGAQLFEYYGASELGFVTVLDPGAAEQHPGSVGRPFFGSDVAVLNADGRAVRDGEVGLLCARTPYGGTHYLREDGHIPLDAALGHHGWRSVGDLARRAGDGFVTLVGRRDRMVVIRGENVYPEESERVLAAQPGVARVAVVAQPATRPTHLVAVVEPDVRAGAPDPAALLRACRRTLSRRATPRRIVFMESLPCTATGKVDAGAAARMLEAVD